MNLVFIIIDNDNDGLIEINDVRKFFNPRKHPDVI
jgi:Ca2+-binding EF-hand superfamily protein